MLGIVYTYFCSYLRCRVHNWVCTFTSITMNNASPPTLSFSTLHISHKREQSILNTKYFPHFLQLNLNQILRYTLIARIQRLSTSTYIIKFEFSHVISLHTIAKLSFCTSQYHTNLYESWYAMHTGLHSTIVKRMDHLNCSLSLVRCCALTHTYTQRHQAHIHTQTLSANNRTNWSSLTE